MSETPAVQFAAIALAAESVLKAREEGLFCEHLLRDEEAFMFYSFPIHSTPSDAEVEERFEELLDKWVWCEATEEEMVGVLKHLANEL